MRLIEKYEHFIIDLDGLVYLEGAPVPGAAELLKALWELGKKVVFATNNSQLPVSGYVNRLRAVGVKVRPEQVVTSAVATVGYLKKRFDPSKEKVFVVGTRSFKRYVRDAGFEVLGLDGGRRASIVIVGRSTSFCYRDLHEATLALRNGAAFIASNSDVTFPSKDGIVPGAGSIIALLELASGRRSEVIGKPNRPMVEMICERFGKGLAEIRGSTLVIGDRLDTDIAMGCNFGLDTALVLSGVTATIDAKPKWKPTYVFNALAEMLNAVV